jgi:hypothetical protein
MLDWRILGASFAALIVVSSVFLGGVSQGGIGDIFSGLIDQISGWFEGSPFGGFVSTPSADKAMVVSIVLLPGEYYLEPDSSVSVMSGSTSISKFSGRIAPDFSSDALLLEERGSELSITVPLEGVVVEDVSIKSLRMSGTGFRIEPDMSTENGTIEVAGFSGTISFSASGAELLGNVTRLTAQTGELRWELV